MITVKLDIQDPNEARTKCDAIVAALGAIGIPTDKIKVYHVVRDDDNQVCDFLAMRVEPKSGGSAG